MWVLLQPAQASDYNVKGRWTWVNEAQWDSLAGSASDPIELRLKSGGGTHMALLRASDNQSWVLHWHHGSTARLWRADAMADATFARPVPTPNNGDFDTFCAGHAVMKDGRLMVVGGTVVGVTGEKRVGIFDVNTVDSNGGWTFPDTTDFGRWYATVTPLADGKMLATSGTQFKNLHLFGGMETDGTDELMNDARLLNLHHLLVWETDQTPQASPRPAVRHGHSSVFHAFLGRTVIFGGMGASGLINDNNKVWALFIENGHQGQDWKWLELTTDQDATNGYPPARHRHTAVIVDNSMFVWGGEGASGPVPNDLWRLDLVASPNPKWAKITVSGGPAARYGHTAVVDNARRSPASMLVYGGRTSSTTFADDKVWLLELNRTNPVSAVSWTELAPSGTSPGSREGHVAVMDTVDTHTNPSTHRMVVFGGNRSSGGLGNDVSILTRQKWESTWSWSTLTAGGTPPSARTRHAAIYDQEWERLLVFGGDTTPSTDGGEVGDSWVLPLAIGSPSWQELWDPSPPPARQGHAMVFDIRDVQAKVPERYDPATNQWSQLAGTSKSGYRWQVNYPFMHLLQSGKLLYGGNGPGTRDTSALLTMDPTPTWSNLTKAGLLGGSSVQTYAPAETVMKFGATDHPDIDGLNNKTRYAVVDPTSGTTTWTEVDPALPQNRRFHNLTFVPDGRVLLSGGYREDLNQQEGKPKYALTPFFYHNQKWGPLDPRLADDPVRRGYHHTAMLLPDARILCAGGPPLDDTLKATVYWPPYLYQNGTTLATRPSITNSPTYTVHYNEPFYVNLSLGDGAPIDSIKILSLIRSGSVTHGFDANQRYLSLPYTITHGMLRTVLTDNPNKAPPGDYLLFGVRTGVGGVPSVAKWIRIDSEPNGVDNVAPAAPAMGAGSVQCPPANPISVQLQWTAPGDDGSVGTATAYDLRYSTSPITDTNFLSLTDIVTTLPPKPAGSTEYYVVPLASATRWYFGLKVRDERAGGWSALSLFDITVCGGGGGGGLPESARPVGPEGPLAAQSQLSDERLIWLGSGIGADTEVALAHAGSSVQIDSAAILRVPRTAQAMTLESGGRLLRVYRRPALQVTAGASDITGSAAGYQASAGDQLVVRFAQAEGVHGVVVTTRSAAADNSHDRSGIRVRMPDGQGGWSAGRWTFSGSGRGEFVASEVSADSVCLEFVGGYDLEKIERLVAASSEPIPETFALGDLRHPRFGQMADAAESVPLEAGETLELRASLPATSAPADVFLYLKTSAPGEQGARAAMAQPQDRPTAFALGQNEPNPFGEGTVIRFALPVKTSVAIEVFDVHGRRVQTLARGEWQAGYHSVSWDGRSGAGQRVGPGIYLYRMVAGAFNATRKLAVLP